MTVVRNGAEGFEMALKIRPDLIVTDLMMPVVSGPEMIRNIRSRPELDAIPIVVLTARADDEMRVDLLHSGAQDYIMKPFSAAELQARINIWVRMKRARDILQHGTDVREHDLTSLAEEVAYRKKELERAVAALEENLRLKDEFLATLSHELRTPMTAVLGWAKILLSKDLSHSEQVRALEIIERNARVELRLIDDLLDISQIASGTFRLDTRPTDLVSVIEAAVESIRPAAQAKNIELHLTLHSLGGRILGDAARLQQVVYNLLTNAVKFTPRGGSIEVSLRKIKDQLEVRVKDTGQGIRPDMLPIIFERFRQADSPTKRPHGGLGLGLAIVRHLVELHGGSVEAQSEGEGRGATFIVSLPLLKESEKRVGEGRTTPGASSLKKARVLVVDDAEDTLELLRLLLEKSEAEVKTAASAPEALEIFENWTPEVLLADIGMPGFDGYELLQAIRALPKGAAVPAVALTGYVSGTANAHWLLDFKPISPSRWSRSSCWRCLKNSSHADHQAREAPAQ
ncbi:MAG: response regulator [Acidobacteria bacterium]|nr:response regulator [Acidobacteriota bacterium]